MRSFFADDDAVTTSPYESYEDELTIDTVASPNYIFDEDGTAEKLAENGDAVEITVDQTATTVTIPATTGATTNDADTLVITLSEALYLSGTAVADGAVINAAHIADDDVDTNGSITGIVSTYDLDTLTITCVIAGTVNDNDEVTFDADNYTDHAGNVVADVTFVYDAAGTIWE